MTLGAAFREEHALADGSRVVIRSIEPEDGPELRRCFARLSPKSRHQRFLGGVTELTDAMVSYLTDVDGRQHVAVVCTTESLDLKTEEGLGVGRFVRLDGEPEVAEAAITVVDDAQGRGIGRLLIRTLATLAIARGVRVFRCEVLADNAGMRHLLEEVGATARPADEGAARLLGAIVDATLVFDVPLAGPADTIEKEPSHPLRRLLRAVAQEIRRLPHPPPLPDGRDARDVRDATTETAEPDDSNARH